MEKWKKAIDIILKSDSLWHYITANYSIKKLKKEASYDRCDFIKNNKAADKIYTRHYDEIQSLCPDQAIAAALSFSKLSPENDSVKLIKINTAAYRIISLLLEVNKNYFNAHPTQKIKNIIKTDIDKIWNNLKNSDYKKNKTLESLIISKYKISDLLTAININRYNEVHGHYAVFADHEESLIISQKYPNEIEKMGNYSNYVSCNNWLELTHQMVNNTLRCLHEKIYKNNENAIITTKAKKLREIIK